MVEWLSLQEFRARSSRASGRACPARRTPASGSAASSTGASWDGRAAWGKDGLVNVPAFFHNAKFYAPPFAFLAAAEQGRFEALCRDLAGQAVADASAALEAGRVVEVGQWESPSPGLRATCWPHSVRPCASTWLRPEYARAVVAARDAHHFRVAESA